MDISGWVGTRSIAALTAAVAGCAGGVVDDGSAGGAGDDAAVDIDADQPQVDDAQSAEPGDGGFLAPRDVGAPPDVATSVADAEAPDVAEVRDVVEIADVAEADAPKSACTGKTRVVSLGDLFIGDFESGSLTGWYDYNASGALNVLAIGSPGAAGTAHAGHLAATSLTSFGAGMGVETLCWDTSALDGIAFWAKGIAGADNRFQFQVAIPATHSVANGGDCTSNCFDHPSKQLVFATAWTQYVVPFTDLKQAGWGTPASYTGIIMALNWVSVDAANVDFWVDEVAFYKGTAGTGPVGGAPSDAGAD